ncbi:MAG TPA: tetratricopeptide repeat protein [Verrucomicrobiae bacterium]|nr:tetratricopeptide repeat protein [Verrucomicrobiae bacterium]
MDKLRRATDLMQKGFSLLDEYCYEEALKVGQKLKKLRHSSAFEILALAHLRSDRLSKAIAVLEEGVAKAGRIWVLWELLGNCYSDAGRYAKAEKAYQKALRLDNCDHEAVHLNRAIAFNRAAKYLEAKSALRFVKSPRLNRRADSCRIRTALKLGNVRAARQLAARLSRIRPSCHEDYDRDSESEILLSCALALKGDPRAKTKALRFAFRAVETRPDNAEALALIREISHRKIAPLFLFSLLIHGVWHSPVGKSTFPPGFLRTLEVAAATERFAFQYAKEFFPPEVRKSLSIEETKTLDSHKLTLGGVYFLSGYIFYPRRRKW